MLERLSKKCTMIILLDDWGTPCEIIPSNDAWETIQRMYNDMAWWLDCWMIMAADINDWEICGWSKVVDCAGRICRRSEQWWVIKVVDYAGKIRSRSEQWGITKVVDYAGKICSRSVQWGITTSKCLISALLIYTFESGAYFYINTRKMTGVWAKMNQDESWWLNRMLKNQKEVNGVICSLLSHV